MPKILFLTLHRKDRSPGQRFRHEQYLSYLEQKGFNITYTPLLDERSDRIFYGQGNVPGKILIGLKSAMNRLKIVTKANRYDIIFIYRDAYFFGVFFEKLLKKTSAKLVFDFDDSIWLKDETPSSSIFQRLKNPSKTNTIISLCDLIIAGNPFLASHAEKFNSNVLIIPTTIDTDEYKPVKPTQNDTVVIGWSGSFSTVKHFESAIPSLLRIKEIFGKQVEVKLIGEANYINKDLDVLGKPWKKNTELDDLREFDIGIMPLPDDNWSKGKCGLKGLQYMALGIPTIMSPVGVNTEIIQDGVNGFLASSDEEWVEKLTLLIKNPDLRQKLGKAGRKTVEEKYSVEANKDKWLKAFQSVLK